jgi:hypothetical protein
MVIGELSRGNYGGAEYSCSLRRRETEEEDKDKEKEG